MTYDYHVVRANPLTPEVVQLFLQSAHAPVLVYQAGQYVEVLHQHHPVSLLSLASQPSAKGILEFHLFHAADNQRAAELLHMTKHHRVWHLRGPFGKGTESWVQPDKPLIFLARGTGFAPIKALIEALIAVKHRAPLFLYWSVPTKADIYLTELLAAWQQNNGLIYTPVYTKASGSDAPIHAILHDHPDLTHTQVYVSGPRPLTHAAHAVFTQHGLQPELFYSDVYAPLKKGNHGS